MSCGALACRAGCWCVARSAGESCGVLGCRAGVLVCRAGRWRVVRGAGVRKQKESRHNYEG